MSFLDFFPLLAFSIFPGLLDRAGLLDYVGTLWQLMKHTKRMLLLIAYSGEIWFPIKNGFNLNSNQLLEGIRKVMNKLAKINTAILSMFNTRGFECFPWNPSCDQLKVLSLFWRPLPSFEPWWYEKTLKKLGTNFQLGLPPPPKK